MPHQILSSLETRITPYLKIFYDSSSLISLWYLLNKYLLNESTYEHNKGSCHFLLSTPSYNSVTVFAPSWDLETQNKFNGDEKKIIRSILLRVYKTIVLKIEVTFLGAVVTPD